MIKRILSISVLIPFLSVSLLQYSPVHAQQIQSYMKHIFMGDRRICSKDQDGNTYYYHYDARGHVNTITDQDGVIVQRIEYTPFGKIAFIDIRAADNIMYRFSGKEYDKEIGLYFFDARYYDPELGRFISPDIYVQNASDPQTLNRYAYCRNNPIIYTDPSGNFFSIISAVVGAIIGAISADRAGGNVLLGAAIGLIAGGIFGALGEAVGSSMANAATAALAEGATISFAQGFMIGAVEFGLGGIGSGMASGFAGGEGNFRDVMKGGITGFAIGFVSGGIIEGLHAMGLSPFHGQGLMQRQADRVAELYEKGYVAQAEKLESALINKYGQAAADAVDSALYANEAALTAAIDSQALTEVSDIDFIAAAGVKPVGGSSLSAVAGRTGNPKVIRAAGRSMFREASRLRPVNAMKQVVIQHGKEHWLARAWRGFCSFFGQNMKLGSFKMWTPK